MGKEIPKHKAGAKVAAKISVSEAAAGRVVRASSAPRLSLARWRAAATLQRRSR